jgi:hypothetical protein
MVARKVISVHAAGTRGVEKIAKSAVSQLRQ